MYTYVNSDVYLHRCANFVCYMIFNYKHHWWDNATDESIELPDDTVFIYKDGDVGQRLYHGFNHYLAATKSKVEVEKEGNGYSIYDQFPGVTFIEFHNCIFNEIPLISGEEFYNKFQLNNYYIFRSTRPDYVVEWEEVDGKPVGKTAKIIPSKPMSITKILSIEGPCRISTLTAHIGSWLGDNREFYSINKEDFVTLMNLTNDYHWIVEIKQDCEKEFVEYINKTLSLVNHKVVYDQPST